MAFPVAAVVMGAVAAYKGIRGAIQNKKAKDLMRKTKDPDYKITQAMQDNQQLAESRAAQGYSDETYQRASDNMDRGTMAGLDTIMKTGGNLNNVGSLFGQYNNAANNLAMLDEEMRVRNIRSLMDQNNVMAGEQDKQWQMNVYRRYANQVQAANTLKAQAQENINGAIDSAASAIGSFSSGDSTASAGKDFKPATNTPARISTSSIAGTPNTSSIADSLRNKYPGLTGGVSIGN